MGLPKMKLIKRISLFLCSASIMFSAGSYFTLKAEEFFYPNKYEILKKGAETEPLTLNDESAPSGSYGISGTQEGATGESAQNENDGSKENGDYDKRVIQAVVEEGSVVTADTVYLVGEVNLSNGRINEKEEEIPTGYIGLDRLGLLAELEEYNKNPPLSELRQGFTNVELTAFSKDRVVVCKYYNEELEEEGFYLMVADHFVVVCKEDRQTIYMNTDILLENLNAKLQEEIIEGKYIENETELYNFLESYSS